MNYIGLPGDFGCEGQIPPPQSDSNDDTSREAISQEEHLSDTADLSEDDHEDGEWPFAVYPKPDAVPFSWKVAFGKPKRWHHFH